MLLPTKLWVMLKRTHVHLVILVAGLCCSPTSLALMAFPFSLLRIGMLKRRWALGGFSFLLLTILLYVQEAFLSLLIPRLRLIYKQWMLRCFLLLYFPSKSTTFSLEIHVFQLFFSRLSMLVLGAWFLTLIPLRGLLLMLVLLALMWSHEPGWTSLSSLHCLAVISMRWVFSTRAKTFLSGLWDQFLILVLCFISLFLLVL